ncbi:U4/U6.U5 tri-snRNP-associated protein [Histoplasma capsulatum H143]|uniref:U4/U6.U5 tri-snRNP-associated protein n=1 Tax=Ajellomyces capsulatus (strain H143) TaxID=544712 RepID=C6H4R4_AJECH|nr:U4/U6.U5 tri-snRNP-associated protein [Histoplasma capsulatum H143]
MAKRPAETSLEGASPIDSPTSKRARVEDPEDEQRLQHQHRSRSPLGERRWEDDERNGKDILAAADQEEEEIEEGSIHGALDSDEEEAGEESAISAPARQTAPAEGYSDLYLDTIQRSVLDFDFEKQCSISLSNINVYACLVCGKYYQGRGPKSHAYFHALDVGHHVFVNMETKKVYVLPEGYEVKSRSLDDIKYVVDPQYKKEEVAKLDKAVTDAWDLAGKRYRPGFVGMNNIKSNDYLNVIVQVLSHVRPIRNFFLLHQFPMPGTPQLPLRFGILVRKLWNPRAFKSHVSPHELLQEVALRSSKRFTLTQQSDPVDFLSWFLNNLHLSLGGSKKPSPTPTSRNNLANNTFPHITLDLPSHTTFQSQCRIIIPQIPLTTLLNKYNGLVASEKLSHRVRHRLLHPLPPYLLFHIKRFSKNKFVSERNPTIVTFPSPRSLDMSPYVEPNPSVCSAGEPILYDLVANVILDATVTAPGVGGNSESSSSGPTSSGTNANKAGVTGSTAMTAGAGAGNDKVSWFVQLYDKAMSVENERAHAQQHRGPEWLEIQDLWVKRTESETLFTREGYLMVWERRRAGADGKGMGKVKS